MRPEDFAYPTCPAHDHADPTPAPDDVLASGDAAPRTDAPATIPPAGLAPPAGVFWQPGDEAAPAAEAFAEVVPEAAAPPVARPTLYHARPGKPLVGYEYLCAACWEARGQETGAPIAWPPHPCHLPGAAPNPLGVRILPLPPSLVGETTTAAGDTPATVSELPPGEFVVYATE